MPNNKNTHTIKILKGTVVKYDGHPIKIAKSFILKVTDEIFTLDDHVVLVEEESNINNDT